MHKARLSTPVYPRPDHSLCAIMAIVTAGSVMAYCLGVSLGLF